MKVMESEQWGREKRRGEGRNVDRPKLASHKIKSYGRKWRSGGEISIKMNTNWPVRGEQKLCKRDRAHSYDVGEGARVKKKHNFVDRYESVRERNTN